MNILDALQMMVSAKTEEMKKQFAKLGVKQQNRKLKKSNKDEDGY